MTRLFTHRWMTAALAATALAFCTVTVAAAPVTQIIKAATSWDGSGGQSGGQVANDPSAKPIIDVVDGVSAPLFGIALAVTPLTVVAGAIAMQFGSQRGPRIMAVGVIGLAIVGSVKGLVA
jgi:hypothetical protein